MRLENDTITRSLFNKDYLLIVQGNAVSAFGDILYSVAIGYYVYEQTGSSTLMGIMSSISLFVSMVLSPFCGTLVDRLDRKGIIVGMDVLRGVMMLIVGGFAYTSNLSVSMIMVVAFLAAICSSLFSPAITTTLIDIIPSDEMVRGQSIQSSITSLLNLVGKAVSGMLVVALGVPVIILLNGVSYLLSAFTEVFIDVPKNTKQNQEMNGHQFVEDLKTAINSIYHHQVLKLFVFSALIVNLLSSGSIALMMPFVLEKGFTVDQYGYLMSIQTVASLIAVSLLGIKKLSHKQRYLTMAYGFIGSVIFYVLGYMASSYFVMCSFLFIGSFCNVLGNSMFNASLMLALPPQQKGSILGLVSSGSVAGQALSSVIYGVLGDIFPIGLIFIIGNILSFIPMCYMCLHKQTKEFMKEY